MIVNKHIQSGNKNYFRQSLKKKTSEPVALLPSVERRDVAATSPTSLIGAQSKRIFTGGFRNGQ